MKKYSFPANSVFTFVLGCKIEVLNAVRNTFADIDVWTDSHTSWSQVKSTSSNNEIAVFGGCVNTKTGWQVGCHGTEVPDSLDSLLTKEWEWGGAT